MSRLSINYIEPERRGRGNSLAQFVQAFVLAVGFSGLAFYATYYIGAHL